ncbi:hypothetical protein [Nesterenkonia haasae]|nr:hypothetical protein [Nesterenkonia haasae]
MPEIGVLLLGATGALGDKGVAPAPITTAGRNHQRLAELVAPQVPG